MNHYRHKKTGSIYSKEIIDTVLKQTNTILDDYEEFEYIEPKTEEIVIEKEKLILSKQELKQLEFEEKIEYLTTLLEIQGGLINV